MKRKATDVLADVFIYVFMAVLSLLCLIPFIHVLSVSISGNGAVMSNQVFLIPKDVNLDAYKTVFGDATDAFIVVYGVCDGCVYGTRYVPYNMRCVCTVKKTSEGQKSYRCNISYNNVLHCRNNSRLHTYEPVAPYKYGGGFDTSTCIFGI